MITNDLTLNPGSYGGTSANLVFVLAGYPNPTASLRRVQATAGTEPNALLISHQQVKRGNVVYNRHLIRRDRTLNTALYGAVKGSAWLTIEQPLGVSEWTSGVMKDIIGHVPSAYLQSGVLDAILAGES
jgi:hypothetical protein